MTPQIGMNTLDLAYFSISGALDFVVIYVDIIFRADWYI